MQAQAEGSQDPESDSGMEPQTLGPPLGWLDEQLWPDKKLAKFLVKEWMHRDVEFRPRLLRWEVNERRRAGERWVGITKNPNRQEWKIYTPPGGSKTPPTLGKAARLCRRLTSQMFQDPPTPEAVPATDSDEDRSSAETCTRILQAMATEAGVNSTKTARIAYNKSHTYGSGFRYWYVDQYGAKAPKRILAHPDAQTIDDATSTPMMDPMMGGPVMGADGQPLRVPHPPEALQQRMVTPPDPMGQPQFTDNETEADSIFVPKLKCEVFTGRQVRMYPATALEISAASYVILLYWTTLGELKREYADVFDQMDDRDLDKLVRWMPEGDHKYFIPDHLRMEDIEKSREKVDDVYPDGAVICTFRIYHKASPDFEQGARVILAGPDVVLCRERWISDSDGKQILLDLPFDQTKGYDEGVDDPYAKGTMDFIGPGDELLANVDSAWITHFQRFSNRKVFVPITSALQNKVMQAGTGTYVPINPGGIPTFEQIPDFPQDTIKLRQVIVENMDDESGMQAQAQGLDSPNVQSGFHAVQVIEQVLAGLAEPRQNCSDAIERGFRIQCQLIRAFYTVPQQTKFLGPDQTYKHDYWMGTDLGSTTDIRILRGTFSMMSPAMKSSIAVSMNQAGVITPYELRRFTIGGTGGMVGIEDDPHWMRVSRQIAEWRKGPPQGWAPPPPPMPVAPPMDPMTGLPPADPTTGMPLPPPPPPLPVAGPPFVVLPVDLDPGIATMRVQELGRAMAGTDYIKALPEWQSVLNLAYQQAQMVVNPPQPMMPAPPPGKGGPMRPLPDGKTPPDAAIAGIQQKGPTPNESGGPPQLDGTPRSPLPPGLDKNYQGSLQ
jgi:hypothetical protein